MRISKLLLLFICSSSTVTAQTDKTATGYKAGLKMSNETSKMTLMNIADLKEREVSAKHGKADTAYKPQQKRQNKALSGIELVSKSRKSLKQAQHVQEIKQSPEDKSTKKNWSSKIQVRKRKSSDLMVNKDGRNQKDSSQHKVYKRQRARARRTVIDYPHEEAPWNYHGKAPEETDKKKIMSSATDVRKRPGKARKKLMKSVSANGDRDVSKQKGPKKQSGLRRLNKKKKAGSGNKQHSTKLSTDGDEKERPSMHSALLEQDLESTPWKSAVKSPKEKNKKNLKSSPISDVQKRPGNDSKKKSTKSVPIDEDSDILIEEAPKKVVLSRLDKKKNFENEERQHSTESSTDDDDEEEERQLIHSALLQEDLEKTPWKWSGAEDEDEEETTTEETSIAITTEETFSTTSTTTESEEPLVEVIGVGVETKPPQVQSTKWVDKFARAPWEWHKHEPPRQTFEGGNRRGYRRRNRREIYYGPRLKYFSTGDRRISPMSKSYGAYLTLNKRLGTGGGAIFSQRTRRAIFR